MTKICRGQKVPYKKYPLLMYDIISHEVHKLLAGEKNRKEIDSSLLDKGRCSVIYPASWRSPVTLTNRICNPQPVYKSRYKFKFYLLLSMYSKNPVLLKKLASKLANRKQ
jgi:hypothetical protein